MKDLIIQRRSWAFFFAFDYNNYRVSRVCRLIRSHVSKGIALPAFRIHSTQEAISEKQK